MVNHFHDLEYLNIHATHWTHQLLTKIYFFALRNSYACIIYTREN